jgi:hypothetical protein
MSVNLGWLFAGMHDAKLASAIADLELDLARKQADFRDLMDDEESLDRVSRMTALSSILADLEECIEQAKVEQGYRLERRARGGLA